jgi:hypothetical protein
MSEDDFTAEFDDACPDGRGVTIDDFVALAPGNSFIFKPTGDAWVAQAVNARLSAMPATDENGKPVFKDGKRVYISASKWLARNRSVVQTVWCPGYPGLIENQVVEEGGWITRPDVKVLNLYHPPRFKLGDASQAGPWIDHVHKVYPEEADHGIKWLAHRVQKPGEKINHALMLGGAQGIGKDTLLEPVKYAVGPWNFLEVSPSHLLGSFNSYARAVILRVSEARDLGETNRFDFYDHTKIYAAAPPDVLRINEKYMQEYYAFNVIGFIITTNYKTDGIYLPPDDRRHFVMWSELTKEDFPPDYWKTIWGWYENGGYGHVVAYLHSVDLSTFDAKAPPRQTAAWHDIVSVNCPLEDAQMEDVLDQLSTETDANGDPLPPPVLTVKMLVAVATGAFAEWLSQTKNLKALRHRLDRFGYVTMKNPDNDRGYWKIAGERVMVYAHNSLAVHDREASVRAFIENGGLRVVKSRPQG